MTFKASRKTTPNYLWDLPGVPKKNRNCLISCNVKAIKAIANEINIIAFRKD
jgi:hypothetical protein